MISEKLSTDSRRMLQKGVPQFVGFCRCTPCRQRRGKGLYKNRGVLRRGDAPRAGSAEAKRACSPAAYPRPGCTPCRQRRGKAARRAYGERGAQRCTPCRQRRGKGGAVGGGNRQRPDAPRAGSAQRNNNVPPDGSLTTGRHFFTFHPSRIPTVAPSSSVTMYNPAPHLLDRSSMAKQNLSYRANVICDGAPPRISAAAVV